MRKLFPILILLVLTSGCAGRIMYVPFGVEEMSGTDRKVVNEYLTDMPICQRWSWTNNELGRSYTINAIAENRRDVNTVCKIFDVDTVYPVGSGSRRNKQVRQMACKKDYETKWVLEDSHDFSEWLYRHSRGQEGAYCATRNQR